MPLRVGLQAEQVLKQQDRRAGRPRLRPRRRRIGDREGRVRAPQSGEDFRQLVAEVGRRLEDAPRDLLRLGPARIAREPATIRELSCGHTLPLWYASGLYPASSVDIVRTPQPDQSGVAEQLSTIASTRSGGTMPLQSRWPMFEQSESTGRLSASSASA